MPEQRHCPEQVIDVHRSTFSTDMLAIMDVFVDFLATSDPEYVEGVTATRSERLGLLYLSRSPSHSLSFKSSL